MKKQSIDDVSNFTIKEQYLYPYCIVWTMLPCISWLLPWIGHVGICSSDGIIHDFMSYHINVLFFVKQTGKLSFNDPYKIVRLEINDQHRFEEALQKASKQFSRLGHNLFCNNCHHYVARVLQLYEYKGQKSWSQFDIQWMCLSQSEYLGWSKILCVYLPFIIICCVISLIVILTHIQM